MDLLGVLLFIFTNSIMLGLSSAVSWGNLVNPHESVVRDSSKDWPVFRRFQWKNLNGGPVARSRLHRTPRSSEPDDKGIEDPQSKAVYWIPTTCDPMVERGYTCLNCGESLHCLGTGFALKAVCFGRRPYCFNGICSYQHSEKCNKEGPSIESEHQSANSSSVLADEGIEDEEPASPRGSR